MNEQTQIPAAALMERMDQIEKKVDKIGEIIVTLARVEERLVSVIEAGQEQSHQITVQEQRLSSLEVLSAQRDAIATRLEKGVWMIVGTVLSIAVGGVFLWIRVSAGN